MVSHTLRQRAEFANMRNAYESEQPYRSASSSDDSYRQRNSGSERSYQTQPTSSGSSAKRPSIQHHETCEGRLEWSSDRYFPEKAPQDSPRASVETYASTVPSEDDLAAEEWSEYELPEYRAHPHDAGAIPATPSDFSDLFPSHRRLVIRHDDSTLDGNMNLRVDTEIHDGGHKRDMSLFHLRMHDLKNREFSLRRYCRDSGREVCHSVRKHQKPAAEKRPGLQRSLSNALNLMRPGSQPKTPTISSLKRNDSGYGSMHSGDVDTEDTALPTDSAAKAQQALTHTIKLEFSNYAQVDIKRSGAKGNKRYEFEYWGASYAWRRLVKQDGHRKEVSFHLTRVGMDQALAFIIPVALSKSEAQKEREKGGWIKPCSMRIADDKIIRSQKDVSDVVVSAGLMALVDDTIRERFHQKKTKQVLPKVEYIGPKRMLNGMFRRDSSNSNSSQQSRPQTRSRPSTSHAGSTTSRTPVGAVRQASYGS